MMAFIAQLLRTYTRTSPPRCIECVHRAVHMHQRKEIAADAAKMRRNDGHRGVGCERSIDRVTTECQHVSTGLGCRAIGTRDDAEARVGAGSHVLGASVA